MTVLITFGSDATVADIVPLGLPVGGGGGATICTSCSTGIPRGGAETEHVGIDVGIVCMRL